MGKAHDLVQYTLLLGLIALGALAMLPPQQASVSTLWQTTGAATEGTSAGQE